jgi:hypothetical protein
VSEYCLEVYLYKCHPGSLAKACMEIKAKKQAILVVADVLVIVGDK